MNILKAAVLKTVLVVGGSVTFVMWGMEDEGAKVPSLVDLACSAVARWDSQDLQARLPQYECFPKEVHVKIFDNPHVTVDNRFVLLRHAQAQIWGIPGLVRCETDSFLALPPSVLAQMIIKLDNTIDTLDLTHVARLPSLSIDYGYESDTFPSSAVEYQDLLKNRVSMPLLEQEVHFEGNKIIIPYAQHDSILCDLGPEANITIVHSKNDKRIIAGTQNGALYMVDVDCQERLNCLRTTLLGTHKLTCPVISVALTNDGAVAASAVLDRGCILWGLDRGVSVRLCRCKEWVKSITFINDDNDIQLTLGNGEVIQQQVPHRYLTGNITNKERVLLCLYQKMLETNEVLPEPLQGKLTQFIDSQEYFEPSIRGLIVQVLLGKTG